MQFPRQAPDAAGAPAPESLAHACCSRWAADRARFALYHEDAAGARSAWSFWDVQRDANRLCNVLAALGVARGDCVAVASAQRPETAVAHIGCYRMGVAVLPLAATLDAATLAFLLDRTAARVVIADAATLAALAEVRDRLVRRIHVVGVADAHAPWARRWEDVLPLAAARHAPAGAQPDDAALWIAGADRAAHALTQRAVSARAADAAACAGGDLLWSPAAWAGLDSLCTGLLAAWSLGQPVLGYSGAFDAEKSFRLIERYGVGRIVLSPAQLGLMMAAVPAPKTEYDLELRRIVCTGAVTPPVAAWAREQLGVAVEEILANEEAEQK